MADIIDVKSLDFVIDEDNKDLDFVMDSDDQSIDFVVDPYVNVATTNYNELINKPQINSVELIGNKSFEELGDHTLSNLEIKNIFNRVFK